MTGGGPVFRLFASCVPVRGARRSTLCDLQRQTYHFIPNGLYEILTVHRDRTLGEIEEVYGTGSAGRIAEYFAFLLDNELGFWCDEPGAFPALDLTWDSPELVTNAIVDVDAGSRHDFAALVVQLDDLGCKALQVRIYCDLPLAEVDAMLLPCERSRLRSVDLVLRYGEWSHEELDALCLRHNRVANVFVHGAPEMRAVRCGGGAALVCYRTESVGSHEHCGQVSPGYFVVAPDLFTEAQAHNTCLNRKISVDVRGEIRNCPSLPRSFGNAAAVSLRQALGSPGFRDLWKVSKDQVEVCKDCEFRYVCTDCRAFLDDPSAPLSKPAKCSYDPYTATWH